MVQTAKEIITLGVLFPLVIVVGGYFSWRLRFLQITKLVAAARMLTLRERSGGISSFGALAAILGGNLGTGNISGVAVALMTGGPGALFWMWIMALLASITKYVGCFLGVHFQQQNMDGEWVGGPMFYLRDGLHAPILAKLFCLFTITSAITVGNLVQVHSLSLPLVDLAIHPLILAIPLALLTAGVIFGGLKRFAHFVSAIVPLMAVAYIGTCLTILFFFRSEILPSIELVFSSAFGLTEAAGGILGFGVLSAMRAGFDRGLFATDSGLGLAPIVHASVSDPNPEIDNRYVQGLISVLSPIIVMVVCSVTGLVLLTTKAAFETNLPSTIMCMQAFRVGFDTLWAGHIVSVTLFFFAFTTILTWSFCANRAVEFLFGLQAVRFFQIIFVAIIPLGVFLEERSLWISADFSTNAMFVINMIGVVGLAQLVFKRSQKKR